MFTYVTELIIMSALSSGLQCQLDLRMSKLLPTSNTKQPNTEKVVTVEKEFRYYWIYLFYYAKWPI